MVTRDLRGDLPIAAGPIFAALEEQVRTDKEAIQTLKVLEKNFSADFAVFRGVCDQLFSKIAKEHPESKKFVALYRDYTDKIFELSNSADEDDLETSYEIFEKISKLGMPAESKEVLDKLFLATKGMMFKAKTSEQRQEYYKKLFVPAVKELLKYLDKKGLNPRLHKEIGKLVVSSQFQEYLGLFIAVIFMVLSGGFIAIPLMAKKEDPETDRLWVSLLMGTSVLMAGLMLLFITPADPQLAKIAPTLAPIMAIFGAGMAAGIFLSTPLSRFKRKK